MAPEPMDGPHSDASNGGSGMSAATEGILSAAGRRAAHPILARWRGSLCRRRPARHASTALLGRMPRCGNLAERGRRQSVLEPEGLARNPSP
eukprot:gene13750-biopygen5296